MDDLIAALIIGVAAGMVLGAVTVYHAWGKDTARRAVAFARHHDDLHAELAHARRTTETLLAKADRDRERAANTTARVLEHTERARLRIIGNGPTLGTDVRRG